MSTAGWKLVWFGLEVGDLGDLVIVSEIKGAQAGLRAFSPGDLVPAGCVLTAAGDARHQSWGALCVEPDVSFRLRTWSLAWEPVSAVLVAVRSFGRDSAGLVGSPAASRDGW